MKMRSSNQYGFTVLELMVVLVLIGILAALLFTALAKAKGSAKRTVCVNNLKQLNLAVRIYADDHGDRLPYADVLSPAAGGAGVWVTYRHLVQSYIGTNSAAGPRDKIFKCPADTFCVGFDDRGPISGDPAHELAPYFTSYLFNGFNTKTNRGAPGLGIAGERLSAVRESAKTVLVGEAPAFVGFSWHDARKELLFPDALNELSYADGHVEMAKIYWNGSMVASGSACYYNPPDSYRYTWRAK